MTLREILNKIFWDKRQRPQDFVITFVHRGAYMNRKTISLKVVNSIQSSWFKYSDERGRETLIPLHRILEIRNTKTGDSIWRKKIRDNSHAFAR